MYGLLAPIVSDFLVGFARDPLAEVEETELRKQLYSALYRHFSDANLKFHIPRQGLDIAYYPERDSVVLTPVKTAYPGAEKFDIAVLDIAAVRPLAEGEAATEQRYKRYWEQPVAVAVQLHLCKPDQDPAKYLAKLTRDLKKFAAYGEGQSGSFAGLSLLLVQGDMAEHPQLTPSELPEEAITTALVIAENGTFAFQ